MTDNRNMQKTIARNETAKALKTFIRSLGMTDWMLMIGMLVSITSVAPFYNAFVPLDAGKEADAVDWLGYWRIISFTLVYVSAVVYILYMMNSAGRKLGIPFVVIHIINIVGCSLGLANNTFSHAIDTGLKNALVDQQWRNLAGGIAASVIVSLVVAVRLLQESSQKKKDNPEVPVESPTPVKPPTAAVSEPYKPVDSPPQS